MQKPGLIWKTYLIYWTVIVVMANFEVFSFESELYRFYQILTAFHKTFAMIYYTEASRAAINILSLIPLYLFVFQKKALAPSAWKTLFALRVVFDICGNYYHFVFIKSFALTDPWLAAQVVSGALLTVTPSYAACYQYAFQQEKVFRPHD